jgi:hypothetical protein
MATVFGRRPRSIAWEMTVLPKWTLERSTASAPLPHLEKIDQRCGQALLFVPVVDVDRQSTFRRDGACCRIVYRKLGLSLLRTAWFNLDWLWARALVVTGMVILLK